jgi:hypothetical protein
LCSSITVAIALVIPEETMDNTLQWVQAILATTAGRWSAMAEFLPVTLARREPAAKEWSAMQCLQHMIDVEAVFSFRLQALMDGRDFPGFDPDSQGSEPQPEQTMCDLALTFGHMRAENLVALAKLNTEDMSRQARHEEMGPVTLSQLLSEWAAHDLNHTMQAERALMQPFIAGCGPWQPYFADHVIA